MKFTIHNLRMIKARFSSNGWGLAGMFFGFITHCIVLGIHRDVVPL